LTALLRAAPASPAIDAYCDGLPERRGRVFWLSQGAFEAASELARSHDAYAYPGLVDMRFLTPLSF